MTPPGFFVRIAFRMGNKVSSEDFLFFNHQLANLLKTDLPIVPGLRTLAKDIRRKGFQTAISDIAAGIESGKKLAEAFAEYPRIFPPTYLAVVKAGEASGNLAETLRDLAVYSQKMDHLQKKLKEILIYPAILLVAVLGVSSFISLTIVPIFEDILQQFSPDYQSKTVIVLLFMARYWPVILVSIIVLTIIVVFFRAPLRVNDLFERWKFRLPIYGKLMRLAALARFSRNLGLMLHSSIPFSDSLQLAGETSGSGQLEKAVGEMKEKLNSGGNWTDALAENPLFPSTFSWMLKTGDKKGDLEEPLFYLADFYNEEFDRQSQVFIHFVEPAIIVAFGLLIVLTLGVALKGGFEVLGGMLRFNVM